ncbi:hypothetical protein JW756_06790 [Candidatus Woesearchaeota archaeon]|nr:hypothetical protein [Candidatus Woesearchaeota archaeon]
MFSKKNRVGQSSMEFVLIAAVMFLVFSGIFVVVQDRMTQAYRTRAYTSMEELSRLVSTEIRMAKSSSGAYTRQFFLPRSLSGYNYSIQLVNMNEMVIVLQDMEYVSFLDVNVSGTIGQGRNVIYKTEDNISINSIDLVERDLCEPGEDDDEGCGVIDCSAWYFAEGNDCYNKQSITTDRCESVGDCKDSNSADCDAQPNYVRQYNCSECQYISILDCNGLNLGTCSNLTIGTSCSGGRICDGYGHCSWTSGATAFVIKDHTGQNVSKFDETGNIILRGTCTASANCVAPTSSFVLKGSGGDVVAYIDINGNLCIEDTNCNAFDSDCSAAGTDSFVIKDSSQQNVMFINNAGVMCLLGNLIQAGNP